MLHSGHIYFLERASRYGEVHVGMGSDATIHGLKGKKTKCCDRERLYQVQSVKYVHRAWINSGRLSDEESGHFPQQIPVKPACRYRQ